MQACTREVLYVMQRTCIGVDFSRVSGGLPVNLYGDVAQWLYAEQVKGSSNGFDAGKHR